ncbi:HugZ family protein [Motiliproteus coralliicola]|uniref:HugZ family protein n=1 Tax=Motiliproteus coralliicola TaxID=2283196 RepID=A0A369WP05_9GAMM|nr:pyridoxamine 5'-phosphate oxidase family protein [Motiliproteus coralliicola]RDE22953.1 HugZ family protein [Motiliproteus coralliicola]
MSTSSDPTSDPQPDLQKVSEAALLLRQRHQTLLLSSLNGSLPELSYAPYCCDDQGNFYIYISQLASHTENLKQHPQCSAMFIAEEQGCRNLFARERLSFSCRAELIEPQDGDYAPRLEQLEQQFGEVVRLLRTLPDFCLFRLCPLEGRYVAGFGRAYQLDPVGYQASPIGPEQLGKGGDNDSQ